MRLHLVTAALLSLASGSAVAAVAPPIGGTVSIEAHAPDGDHIVATPPFLNAVRDALSARGFTVLDGSGHAAWVADVAIGRVDAGTGSARVRSGGVTAMPGALAGAGAGVSVPLGTGRSTLVPLQRTEMSIRLHKRGDPATTWSGTAATVRPGDTDAGSDDAVAAALCAAMLRDYPAQPAGAIGVP